MKDDQIVLNAVRMASYRKGYKRAQEDLVAWLTIQESKFGDGFLDKKTLRRLRNAILNNETGIRTLGEQALAEFSKARSTESEE